MTANLLDRSQLSILDVHRLLKLKRQRNDSFASQLSLEPLTELERQDLEDICNYIDSYYAMGKLSEGEVKFLILSPLLWLSGFYDPSLIISLEQGIAEIAIEDKNTIIKGRMDILAAQRIEEPGTVSLWLLVIEAKNSSAAVINGLPQLLTYAYKSLEHQRSVWGITTNGKDYLFVKLQQGNPPIYQVLPELNLARPEHAIELLQILKAICKLHQELLAI